MSLPDLIRQRNVSKFGNITYFQGYSTECILRQLRLCEYETQRNVTALSVAWSNTPNLIGERLNETLHFKLAVYAQAKKNDR